MSLSSVLDSAEDMKSGFFSLNKMKNTGMFELFNINISHDCGLVVRVSGYRYRGPGFDSRPYQIF